MYYLGPHDGWRICSFPSCVRAPRRAGSTLTTSTSFYCSLRHRTIADFLFDACADVGCAMSPALDASSSSSSSTSIMRRILIGRSSSCSSKSAGSKSFTGGWLTTLRQSPTRVCNGVGLAGHAHAHAHRHAPANAAAHAHTHDHANGHAHGHARGHALVHAHAHAHADAHVYGHLHVHARVHAHASATLELLGRLVYQNIRAVRGPSPGS